MNLPNKPNTDQGLGRREFISKALAAGIITTAGIKLGDANTLGAAAAEDRETGTGMDNERNTLTLWYDGPAAFRKKPSTEGGVFRSLIFEGLLIGNSRLGAMIKGEVGRELLALSEHSLMTGGLNPSGSETDNIGAFQTLGNLVIELPGHEPYDQYRRSLDINRAISETRYSSKGIAFHREYFSSCPDEVLVIRLTASQPGSYSGVLCFIDGHQRLASFNENLITIPGSLENGLRYETQILVLNEGGTQKIGGAECEQRLEFNRCDSLTILVAAGTDYAMDAAKYFRSGEDPHLKVTKHIHDAAAQDYEQLKARHIVDYQFIFRRFAIDVGSSTPAQRALPTDQRLVQAASESDPEFEQLVCQYGRYLMIGCSRPGGLPSAEQGMWEDCNLSSWRGLYTDDIAALEDSYWGVEPSNLAECHEPLLNLIQSQLPIYRKDTQASAELKLASGALTSRGWEIRGNFNAFGGMWGWWNKGGNAWFCNLFWEHYAFSNDAEYLRKTVYPLLKETCEYWEDHLKALPDGRLIVTDMMYSPEHGPFHVDGCSYCQELVFDLFTNYLDTCDILDVDRDYRTKVGEMREKLLKPGIGSWGQLMEWMTEMKDHVSVEKHEKVLDAKEGHIDTPANKHRHSSQLLGVFPLRQISYEQTPALAAAAKVSAIARGTGEGDMFHTLSFSHRIPVFARLYDGDRAYELIRRSFAKMEGTNLCFATGSSDMALSKPAGFCEMLVQSHQKDIHVLPALPKAWPTGRVKGIRARGGFEVDEAWKDGKLASLTIRSIAGNAVNVRYGAKTAKVEMHPGESVTLDGDLQRKNKG